MTGEQAGEETQVPGGSNGRMCLSAPTSHAAAGCDSERDGASVNDSASQPGWRISCFRGCLWLPPVVWTNKNSDWQGVEWHCDSARLLKTSNSFLSSCQQSNARQAPGDGDEPDESQRMNESCRCIPRCDSTADLPSLGLPSRRFSHPSQEG
ncbi:hypothetical protein CFAM422_006214 [Trichoderma lentiforme]|uniref:Uncharacterized protein n=1 Tax=Trichoderma lentiforme TaxID=1567552 RepID=A0A9P4XEZ4_9HYPO|nr:hypothetical protein CFAM422_006214 [Trichoderma lentiforme]